MDFNPIKARLNEFLSAKPIVDEISILFKDAIDNFNPNWRSNHYLDEKHQSLATIIPYILKYNSFLVYNNKILR